MATLTKPREAATRTVTNRGAATLLEGVRDANVRVMVGEMLQVSVVVGFELVVDEGGAVALP